MKINFSKLKLNEDALAAENIAAASEKAIAGGEKQREGTNKRREAQKSQMAQQQSTVSKSDISYASEELIHALNTHKELQRLREENLSDWRKDLNENDMIGGALAQGDEDEENDHPYVEVMPSTNFKADEAKRQMAAALKAKKSAMAGGAMANSTGVEGGGGGEGVQEGFLSEKEDKALDNVLKAIRGEGGVMASDLPKGGTKPQSKKPTSQADDGDTSQGRYRPRKPWHGKHG